MHIYIYTYIYIHIYRPTHCAHLKALRRRHQALALAPCPFPALQSALARFSALKCNGFSDDDCDAVLGSPGYW